MYFNTRNLNPLTIEQSIQRAPSIAATKAHDRTSSKYLFIPTEKILNGLTDNGWSIVSATQSRSKTQDARETTKHAVMLARTDALGSYGSLKVGDTLPLLKVINSHNGLSSFGLDAAIYRLACANGMTVPEGIVAAPRVKHTINVDRDTIEASFRVIEEFPRLMESVNTMKSIDLNEDEKRLFAQSAARIVFDEERVQETNELAASRFAHSPRYRDSLLVENQILRPRRYEDNKSDLWTVFNRIQENAVKGGVQLKSGDRDFRAQSAIKNIDRDSKVNKELMTLAAEMAKLKGHAIAA